MSIRKAIFLAAFALAACSPPQASTNSNTAAKPREPESAQATAPQQVADVGKPSDGGGAEANLITPQFLLGRWGDNGDCTKDIVFNPDGSYTAYPGGSGRWQINGDSISMSGAGGTFSLQMQLIDQDHLRLRNPDGSIGTSQRC